MRQDLLKFIGEQKDQTHAVILTHNIDFFFIQNLLLDALRRCGAPTLTIFADEQCAAEMYSLQAPLLSSLGRRYRVVSVRSHPYFRFHPKALFLSGPENARLVVGSGNLTFGGWRQNAEIWAAYKSEEGTAEISEFRGYLDRIVAGVSLNQGITDEISEAFDPGTRKWASQLQEPAGLVGRLGEGSDLISRLAANLGKDGGERLTVCSPYFDATGEAVQMISEKLGVAETLVLVDPEGTNLQPAALAALPSSIQVRSATVRRDSTTSKSRAFLHAKFYAVQKGKEVTLALGSANCSKAALTLQGARGNSELMAIQEISLEDYEGEILAEIDISPEPPVLESTTLPSSVCDHDSTPRILAAHLEDGHLRIAYSSADGWEVSEAIIDDEPHPVTFVNDSICECPAQEDARSVRLAGLSDKRIIKSPAFWIDHEASLATTAYRRSFRRAFSQKARQGESWLVGDIADLLGLFCQDLEYVPRGRTREVNLDADETIESEARTYTRADLFGPALKKHHAARPGLERLPSVEAVINSLFGFQGREESKLDPDRDPDPKITVGGELGSDEPVDTPEPIDVPKRDPVDPEKARRKVVRDRKRLRKNVIRMADRMSSESFLQSTDPTHLADHLISASHLCCFTVRKGWMEKEDFFSATFKIWSAVFLSDKGTGTSAGRRNDDVDPAGGMVASLRLGPTNVPLVDSERLGRQARLSAALFSWALEIPEMPSNPREAQLLLALSFAVSRYIELWVPEDMDEMITHLSRFMEATGGDWNGAKPEWIIERWGTLKRFGGALGRFEKSLEFVGFRELKRLNMAKDIHPGDLMYQGKLGYCIADSFAELSPGKGHVKALLLKSSTPDSTKFMAKMTNPVKGPFRKTELFAKLLETEADARAIDDLLALLRESWKE